MSRYHTASAAFAAGGGRNEEEDRWTGRVCWACHTKLHGDATTCSDCGTEQPPPLYENEKPPTDGGPHFLHRLAGGAALPALSNPRTEAIVEGWPVGGSRRGKAWFAVESGPRGERASRRTENRDGTGWNAPKLTTYAIRTRIADGDDGRTYIVRDVGSHINVMQGDMQHDAGNAFPGDPQHAALLSLFGPPEPHQLRDPRNRLRPGAKGMEGDGPTVEPGPGAVTACRHGGFLTEETCATCRAEAEERAEHAPHAAEPERAGMDKIDLEAERLGRGMGPSKSFVRQPAVHRRTRAPQGSRNAAAIALVRKWLADDSGYDERAWPALREGIEGSRLSTRKRFGPEHWFDAAGQDTPKKYALADDGEARPPRLPDGTRVHVRSEQFEEECDGVVREGEYDGGWLYRIEVTSGDRLEAQRTPRPHPPSLWDTPADEGELWVCDFEVQPIRRRLDDLVSLIDPESPPAESPPAESPV